jgi:hypothetical protein
LGTSRPFTTLQSEAVNGEGERDFEVELEESMVGVSKRSSPVIEVKEKLPSRSREYEHFKEFSKLFLPHPKNKNNELNTLI